MTELILDLNKSVEENASIYYDKAKKIKKKIAGAKEALAENLVKLKKAEKEHLKEEAKETKKVLRGKKEWYEKFRWFITSKGFLVVGGRDATTNEIIIKKHTDTDDLVFHTDLAGSPFFVIKAGLQLPDNPPPPAIVDDDTLKEVADATVSYSRTWKLGLSNSPVFYVKPEQVTKDAPTGEYLVKGAFVIKGKTNYVENKINLAVGMTKDNKVMGGPIEAVKAHCEKFVEIKQGREKASSVAKYIQKKVGGSIDEIIAVLPSGGCAVKK
jgi:predicted ribosome quality control (RQC) complex YloA/Tae2 family protein